MTFRLHYLEQQEAQSNVAVQAYRREPYLGSPSGVGTVQAQADMSNDYRGSLKESSKQAEVWPPPQSSWRRRTSVGWAFQCAVHTGSRSDRPDKCDGNQEWVVCLLDLWDRGVVVGGKRGCGGGGLWDEAGDGQNMWWNLAGL